MRVASIFIFGTQSDTEAALPLSPGGTSSAIFPTIPLSTGYKLPPIKQRPLRRRIPFHVPTSARPEPSGERSRDMSGTTRW